MNNKLKKEQNMIISKTLTNQPKQLKKLFDSTKMYPAHFDKLIGSENLNDSIAIISGSDVDISRFVAAHFSYEGANVTKVSLSRENDIEAMPELVKKDEGKTNIKSKDINKPIRNKSVSVYGDLNFQAINSYDQKPVENLENQNYSSFVNQQIEKPKHLTTAGSIDITNRERQVILLVAEGFSNKEIAQKLHLSTYTIKSHIHNILVKLSLNTRLQIAKHVYQNEYYKNAM